MVREFPEVAAEAPEIGAGELKRRIDAGEDVSILDVRRHDDFQGWHISGPSVEAVNVPFTAFLTERDEPVDEPPRATPDGPVVTVCAEGVASHFVARVLRREGRDAAALRDGMHGWARLYESQDLSCEAADVVQFRRPSSGCLSYMIVSGDDAVVVDPLRAFAERYERDALDRGARVVAALDTHVHADHVSGVRAVADLTGAEVVLPEGAEHRGLSYEASYSTVTDGDAVAAGDVELEAIALPGHTTEMTGYVADGLYLTGDAVFLDGVARPDLERGDEGAPEAASRLFESLDRLASLPDDARIAPGHRTPSATPDPDGGYTATVGALREELALFGADDPEAFVDRITTEMPPRPENYREIIAVNLGREDADAEEAFELELGPNNCAVAE